MKKNILLVLVFIALNGFAQDTTKNKFPKYIDKEISSSHEIGANTTLLLKQVFNLSNNTFPTLPYDLTYKYIRNNSGLRVGLGVTVNNSTVTTTNTTSSTTAAPTINNSTNLYYRVGYERRYRIGAKILAYWGIDFAGQYGTSQSQSQSIFDNMPNSYSSTKTTDNIKLMVYGGGPVAGIQFYIAKHISVGTEMPFYFLYSNQEEVTETTTSDFDTFNGWRGTYDSQTQTTKNTHLSVTLPVTLYLSIKF